MKSKITILVILLTTIVSCTKPPTNSLEKDNITSTKTAQAKTHNYESFYGEYETRPNANIKIFAEEGILKIQGPSQPKMDLRPTTSPNRFFLEEFQVHIEFVSNGSFITKLLMIRGDGQSLEAPKVK